MLTPKASAIRATDATPSGRKPPETCLKTASTQVRGLEDVLENLTPWDRDPFGPASQGHSRGHSDRPSPAHAQPAHAQRGIDRKRPPGGGVPPRCGKGAVATRAPRGAHSAIERRRAIAPMDRTHARGEAQIGHMSNAYGHMRVHMRVSNAYKRCMYAYAMSNECAMRIDCCDE